MTRTPPRGRPASQPGKHADDALAGLLQHLGSFATRARVFAAIERDNESLDALCAQARSHQSGIETPLRVLLLGGTGVGKSTLLNALAGESIAPTGAVRPTTRTLNIYLHEEAPAADLGSLDEHARFSRHRRPTLRDKIIIDAPDYDSSVDANRRTLDAALAVADLVLCVVTAEKYLSAPLFERLRGHRDGLKFVFVVNKADMGGSAMVADDLARGLASEGFDEPRVLCLSARQAMEAACSPETASGAVEGADDFARLEDLLQRELDHVRIRRIKTSNQRERLARLASRISAGLPSDGARRLARWRQGLRDDVADLAGDLAARAAGEVRGDPRVRLGLSYLHGQSFRSLAGAFLSLIWGLKALLRPGWPGIGGAALEAPTAAVDRRLEEIDPDELAGRLRGITSRFLEGASRHGLESEAVGTRLDAALRHGQLPALDDQRGAAAALLERLRQAASQEVRRVSEQAAFGHQMWLLDAAINLPAWTLVLLTLVAPLTGFLGLTLAGTGDDLLNATLAFGLLSWLLAERAVARRVSADLTAIETRLAECCAAVLDHTLAGPAREAIDEVSSLLTEAGALQARARALAPAMAGAGSAARGSSQEPRNPVLITGAASKA